MAEIVNIAASAAGGGVFGLVGTALGRVAGYFEKRQIFAQERDRWAHETNLLQLQREEDVDAAESERALALEAGRWAGLTASLQSDASIGPSYRWVNAVRGLTRPALTLLLWLITCAVFSVSDAASRDAIVDTATFAATAATLWWFGDRGPQRDFSETGLKKNSGHVGDHASSCVVKREASNGRVCSGDR